MKEWRLVVRVGVFGFLLWLALAAPVFAQTQARYIGAKACGECHDKQYATFSKYAKKANSAHSVQIMAPKLTPEEVRECFGCHATGYGKPGGFVSVEKTPELANAGCEVCHGPGSAHAEAGGDKRLIKRTLSMADCESCHNAQRVRAFGFKPMLFGGAH